MIYVVTHHDFSRTVWRIKRQSGGALPFIRPITYRGLFLARKAPVGHYIFTDFDRLTGYEMQVADAIARRVAEVAPEARILNRPALVLERYPLLRRLEAEGLNSFTAYRLDGGEMPKRYPVFIRSEDDCKKPDTGLIHSEAELEETIRRLRESGMPMKRKIAVEFCAERAADGHYRKFGVFRIGDRLVPQHVQRNSDWYVKRHAKVDADEAAFEAEADAFSRDNPHADAVRRAFDIANIGFGRADYSVVGGRVQIYEINTNPTLQPMVARFSRRKTGLERRERLRVGIVGAFNAINEIAVPGPPEVRFELPRPRMHKFDPLPMRARVGALYERLKVAVGR